MSRKHFLSILLGLFLVVSLTACVELEGKGPKVTLTEDSQNYTRLDVSHAFKVKITQGDKCKAEVRVPENLREYVRMEVKDGTLVVGLKQGFTFRNTSCELDVTLPKLEKIDFSGACDGELVGKWSCERLDIGLSGASDLNGQVEAKTLTADLSGATSVTLSGGADTVSIQASGASNAKMKEFKAKEVTVDLSGASDASIHASGVVKGEASGASDVHVLGGASVDVDTSGGSSVHRE